MKSSRLKENIIQVLLIFIGVLIAFAVDRWYDRLKVSKNKNLFLADQIDQFTTEKEGLSKLMVHNEDLLKGLEKALMENQSLDTILENTQRLNYRTNFNSDFTSLSDLREVYQIDDFLNLEMKKRFKKIFQNYWDIDHYEDNFDKVMDDQYGPFRRRYFNRHNQTYIEKKKFASDEFLNILSSCKVQLRNKNVMYKRTQEEIESLISELEKLKN